MYENEYISGLATSTKSSSLSFWAKLARIGVFMSVCVRVRISSPLNMESGLDLTPINIGTEAVKSIMQRTMPMMLFFWINNYNTSLEVLIVVLEALYAGKKPPTSPANTAITIGRAMI